MAPYSAAQVSNGFLKLAAEDEKPLSQLALQKLLYFAHGWYLGYHSGPLVDETFQAWELGPVIEGIYHEFKHYGHRPIERPATEVVYTGEAFEDPLNFQIVPAIEPPPTDTEAWQMMRAVWVSYGRRYSPGQLVNMTHIEGGPWHTVMNAPANRGVRNPPIDNDTIREYFSALVEQPSAVS